MPPAFEVVVEQRKKPHGAGLIPNLDLEQITTKHELVWLGGMSGSLVGGDGTQWEF